MIDTDDKMANDTVETGEGEVASDADVLSPENNNESGEARREEKSGNGSSFVGELVGISVKAIAVALSLFIIIVSILTVAMPLSAMRVFNNLGMYERALNSGDSYITSRLDDVDANKTDESGEYTAVRFMPSLADADMIEALDVCINLSDSLMRDYADSDKKSTAYFADELDKYIRLYMSLYGESALSKEKSSKMLDAMPPALHPFVYNYEHTLVTLDYAARVYSGDAEKLNTMIWPASSSTTSIMWSTARFSNNLLRYEASTESGRMTAIDWFVDYIDQISTYLGIQEERLGLTTTTNEEEAKKKYVDVLNGYEFSLLVTPEDGFTTLYYELKEMFNKYAKLACDFNINGSDEIKLHKLYWLRILTTASDRLWNMGVLLNFNNRAYGQHSREVYDEYGDFVFHHFKDVFDGYDENGTPIYREIVKEYNSLMTDYLRNFPAAA